MKLKFINLNKFEKTNYRYLENVAPNPKYHSHKKAKKITFRLPNNTRDFYFNIPNEILYDTKKSRKLNT